MSRSITLIALACLPFSVNAALVVNNSPGNFVDPIAQLDIFENVIQIPSAADPSFIDATTFSFELDPASSNSLQMGGFYFFRGIENPDTSSVIATSSFQFFAEDRLALTKTYSGGAEAGDDNWIYIGNNSNERAWAQVEIQEGVVTPIKFIYDTSDRTAAISLPDAVAAVPEPGTAGLIALSLLAALRRRRAA